MKPTPLSALVPHTSATLISGAAIDSRLVQPGDLFFALKGERVDGHAYLEEAKAGGAAAFVVSETYRGSCYGLPVWRVPDVLFSLQETARLYLEKNPKRVVGITGSLGKTTTKYFAKTLLEARYSVYASPKSYNSQATLPLSILLSDPQAEILLLEMGMSEPGNLARLIEIAPPEVAVVTLISLQHAENFPDGLEGIRREKLSILSHPKTRLGLYFEGIGRVDVGVCRKESFSVANRYHLDWPPQMIHNLCAAEAIAHAFGIEESAKQLPKLTFPPMRFEQVEKRGITFINDAYNANPESMRSALAALPPAKGKKIALLSEMDALGSFARAGHAQVAECALDHVDLLLCIGERCETMAQIWKEKKRPCVLCKTKEALRAQLREVVAEGDLVLLKGARAYALEEILEDY